MDSFGNARASEWSRECRRSAAERRRYLCARKLCGDADEPFKVLGLVVGFTKQERKHRRGGQAAYEKGLKAAHRECRKSWVQAVFFSSDFQNRVAIAQGCGGPRQAFEVFAWGTAVQWVKTGG